MIKMIATKPLKYATRRLLPDDGFTARSESHARVLEATKRAKRASAKAPERFTAPKVEKASNPALEPEPLSTRGPRTNIPADPAINLAAPAADERPALRAEYEAKLGRKAFPGWSAEVLRKKIASADEATT